MIVVTGGIYRELCSRPRWDEYFGSAGRAATAIATLGGEVDLIGYVDAAAKVAVGIRMHFLGEHAHFTPHDVGEVAGFYYTHGLQTPAIHRPNETYGPIEVKATHVLSYGMLMGEAVVTCDYAVYDPQNVGDPRLFRSNGSSAKHLALVLNRHEARSLLDGTQQSPAEMAVELARRAQAEVVIIKQGPMGALVYEKGEVHDVPAYRTQRVWKIGTGDQFAANFAYAWMEEQRTAAEAADRASRATALFCDSETGFFPTREQLDNATLEPIRIGRHRADYRAGIYLAGPFFTLGQLWVVEEAKAVLEGMGFRVLSPYHDVGHGSADDVIGKDLEYLRQCDVVLAIGDGMDPGTIFEVGYARALDKPVIFYAENEPGEDRKMIEGSQCRICDDFVSAIYLTAWEAVEV